MRRSPYGNVEFALVADGVPVDEVYDTLSTPAGVERAFRKLDSMAAVSQYISYSPSRHSGLVTTHQETGVEMEPHMPVTPARLERSVFNDWAWWADYGDEINDRFGAWLAR